MPKTKAPQDGVKDSEPGAKGEIPSRGGMKGIRIKVHLNGCWGQPRAEEQTDSLVEVFRDEILRSGRGDILLEKTVPIGLRSMEPLVSVERFRQDPVIYKEVRAERARTIFREHVLAGKVPLSFALARGVVTKEKARPIHSDLEGKVSHVFDHPFFGPQENRLLRNRGIADPDRIESFVSRGAYQALAKALREMTRDEIIREIQASGMKDREGMSGFPTAVRWQFCASAKGDVKYVICDAHGGHPEACLAANLILIDPHALLEGMAIAARAIGAHQGFIYSPSGCPALRDTLAQAIAQAKEHGFLGKNILRSGFDFDLEIREGSSSCFCGEETAVIDAIEGGEGKPRRRPPFPVLSGLWGKPTLLHGVETLLNVPFILREGGEEYVKLGTEFSKGTRVFALSGKVNYEGLIEVPMGTTLGEVIFDIGGGISGKGRFKGARLGGPMGGFLSKRDLNMPLDEESLSTVGLLFACGDLSVFDESACAVREVLSGFDLCKSEACGLCETCEEGLQRVPEILDRISKGRGELRDLDELDALARGFGEPDRCRFGQYVSAHIRSALRAFRQEFLEHIVNKRCSAGACQELVQAPCTNLCPVGIDIPRGLSYLRRGLLGEAYRVVAEANPLSGVCGRVCSHPCEDRCRRREMDESVAIANLERFISDRCRVSTTAAFPVTRKERVAVVGAGPAGLSAAWELRRRGYAVTIFDENPEPGGMMRYGIPSYRLPRKELALEIKEILARGIEFRSNTRVGKDVTWESLKADFDAICFAPGCPKSCFLQIPGEAAKGVMGGIEFLKRFHMGQEVKVGRRVAVIGGGDVAVEVARSALRLGAKKVTLFYHREHFEMTADPSEIEAAIEEGVVIRDKVTPTRIITHYGRVGRLELTEMRRGPFDKEGRRTTRPILGSEFVVDVDTILVAIQRSMEGENVPEGVEVLEEGNRIKVDEGYRTTHRKIWAAGDAVTGPSRVVWAIRGGRDVGVAIDRALRGSSEEDEAGFSVEGPASGVWTPEEAEAHGRVSMPTLEPELRKKSFSEVRLGYRRQMALSEAKRCLQCGLKKEEI